MDLKLHQSSSAPEEAVAVPCSVDESPLVSLSLRLGDADSSAGSHPLKALHYVDHDLTNPADPHAHEAQDDSIDTAPGSVLGEVSRAVSESDDAAGERSSTWCSVGAMEREAPESEQSTAQLLLGLALQQGHVANMGPVPSWQGASESDTLTSAGLNAGQPSGHQGAELPNCHHDAAPSSALQIAGHAACEALAACTDVDPGPISDAAGPGSDVGPDPSCGSHPPAIASDGVATTPGDAVDEPTVAGPSDAGSVGVALSGAQLPSAAPPPSPHTAVIVGGGMGGTGPTVTSPVQPVMSPTQQKGKPPGGRPTACASRAGLAGGSRSFEEHVGERGRA